MINKYAHTVFVYGTLKHGFFNYNEVLLPALLADQKYQQDNTQNQLNLGSLRTTEDNDLNGDALIPKTLPLCQRVEHKHAYINGLLFVDAYFVPYLIPGDLVRKDGAPTFSVNPVYGEIYSVNDEMLARLDELEGIEKGRYKRSRVHVCISSGKIEDSVSEPQKQELQAWVYHLSGIPPPVAAKLSGGGDCRNELLRNPQTLKGIDCIQFLSSYKLDEHRAYYLPQKERDNPDRFYQSWGGYLF